MSKRKIMLLAMTIIMVAILAVGGTLAYFTSEDDADNVFVMGNVDITLEEEYEQNSNLQPGIEIEKEVSIKNTGTNPAYVRAHIAIPSNLDAQDPTKSGDNVWKYLHFIYGDDDNWDWENADGEDYFYTTTLPNASGTDEEYNVYVVTYLKALASDAETGLVIEGVYLDTGVDAETNRKDDEEDGEVISYTYVDEYGHEVTLPIHMINGQELAKLSIKVFAEATQTATFKNAHEALDTAFGVAGEVYDPWNGAYDAE